MKKIYASLSLFFLLNISLAAQSLPRIQGVCRITLHDTKVIEGFIELGHGGENGKIWMNGFYFQTKESYSIQLFDLNFARIEKSIAIQDYKLYKVDTTDVYKEENFLLWFPKGDQLRYLQCEVEDDLYDKKKSDIVQDENKQYWVQERIARKKYKLLDSLSIYSDLGYATAITYGNKSKPIKVALKDIKSFTILSRPSQKWLAKIEQSYKKGKAEGYAEDLVFPVWFHEANKTKHQDRYTYLRERMKINEEY